MSDRANKITSLFIFMIIAGFVVFINLFIAQAKGNDVYRQIKIFGNNLLPSESYVEFCELTDPEKFDEIGLASVKKRFEEHPYVTKADVKYDGIDCIEVNLYEKDVKATIVNAKLKLITNKFEILPVYQKTIIRDIPIISHMKFDSKSETIDTNNDEGIKQAFRIIDAVKFVDQDFFNKLSEINLMNGGNVILTFEGITCPVIFGKQEEAKKLLALDQLLRQNPIENNLLKNIEYIDLRYTNKIYIGKKENING